eukprot:scaffold13.g301.t1
MEATEAEDAAAAALLRGLATPGGAASALRGLLSTTCSHLGLAVPLSAACASTPMLLFGNLLDDGAPASATLVTRPSHGIATAAATGRPARLDARRGQSGDQSQQRGQQQGAPPAETAGDVMWARGAAVLLVVPIPGGGGDSQPPGQPAGVLLLGLPPATGGLQGPDVAAQRAALRQGLLLAAALARRGADEALRALSADVARLLLLTECPCPCPARGGGPGDGGEEGEDDDEEDSFDPDAFCSSSEEEQAAGEGGGRAAASVPPALPGKGGAAGAGARGQRGGHRQLAAVPLEGLDLLLRFRDPKRERRYTASHGHSMYKVDLAAFLLLLAAAVLAGLQDGHPCPLGSTASLAANSLLLLPLPLLLVARWRPWYLANRERFLLLFWVASLAWHAHLHSAAAGAASMAAGAARRGALVGAGWVTVQGMLVQMRFCRQLPVILGATAASAAAVLVQACPAAHPGCVAAGTARAVGLALAPLAATYLAERRARQLWLQSHPECSGCQ